MYFYKKFFLSVTKMTIKTITINFIHPTTINIYFTYLLWFYSYKNKNILILINHISIYSVNIQTGKI